MLEEENRKKRDFWDKADVGGKWLIPIVVALATIWYNSAQNGREARQKVSEGERAEKQKTFEVAIGILQAPQSAETAKLRGWALSVFQDVTNNAYGKLPPGAVEEINNGAQLPTTSQLRLPTPSQLRVFIMRIEGASTAQSDQIKSALIGAGYTNVTTTERSQFLFPQKAEVRYYYPSDSQNAQSLSDYINRNVPGVATTSRDRSHDPDASAHRPGDLHVYVR